MHALIGWWCGWKAVAVQETVERLLFLLVWSSSFLDLSQSSGCCAVLFWPCRRMTVLLCWVSVEKKTVCVPLQRRGHAEPGQPDEHEAGRHRQLGRFWRGERGGWGEQGQPRGEGCQNHWWDTPMQNTWPSCTILFANVMSKIVCVPGDPTDRRNLYLQSRFRHQLCCLQSLFDSSILKYTYIEFISNIIN